MKKSELKQLIREIIEETQTNEVFGFGKKPVKDGSAKLFNPKTNKEASVGDTITYGSMSLPGKVLEIDPLGGGVKILSLDPKYKGTKAWYKAEWIGLEVR